RQLAPGAGQPGRGPAPGPHAAGGAGRAHRRPGAAPFRRHRLDFPGSGRLGSAGLEGLRGTSQSLVRLSAVTTRAVYPGSFDPLTNGHLDLIERSLRIFDELIVAVVTNPAKTSLFSDAERVEMIHEATRSLGHIEIMVFEGLLVDFVKRVGARAIVRGRRARSDFEYEFQMALMNRKLREEIETVFLMPHEAYSYISSRLIKEVAGYGGSVKGLVPAGVEQRLRERLRRD